MYVPGGMKIYAKINRIFYNMRMSFNILNAVDLNISFISANSKYSFKRLTKTYFQTCPMISQYTSFNTF